MGLITKLVTLPVSGPISASLWIAGQVAEAVDAQWSDPVAIRAALEDLERQFEAGEISEDAFEEQEDMLLQRLEQRMAGQDATS